MILTKKGQFPLTYFFAILIAFILGNLLMNRPILFSLFFITCIGGYYFFTDRTDVLFLMLTGMILFIPWQKPAFEGGWGIPSGKILDIPIPVTVVIMGFFAFAFILRTLFKKELRSRRKIPLFNFFLFYLIIGLISSVLNVNSGQNLWFLFFQFLIPVFFIFYGSYFACKNRNEFLYIISGLILFISAIGLYAIFEFLTKSNPVETFFAPYFPGRWSPFSYVEGINQYCRVAATLGNSTFLGSTLVAGICLALGFFSYSKTLFKKFAFFCSILINFIALGLSANRGGILGLIIAILVFSILIGKKKFKEILLYVFLPVLLITLCFIWSFALVFLEPRFSLENVLGSSSFQHRINAYYITVNFLRHNPLFGMGFANFEEMYYKITTPFIMQIPTMDNMFLAILSFTGILGLISFASILLSLFGKITIMLKKLAGSEFFLIYTSLFCGLIALLVSFMFYDAIGHLAVSFMFWSLAGIGITVFEDPESFKNID